MSKKQHFFSRELSWVEFNARVLAEASREDVPLFERLKFLGIVASNFDEFFMVRVASLKRQALTSPETKDIAGFTAQEQLTKISERVHELLKIQYDCLNNELLPKLQNAGLTYVSSAEYTPSQTSFLKNIFKNEIFPLLTPLRTDKNMPFPHVSNLKIHAAFLLSQMLDQKTVYTQFNQQNSESQTIEKNPIAIVQVPTSIDRIIWFPSENQTQHCFTMLEDVIQVFGTYLFPGFSVLETLMFKVTRDADFAVDEDRSSDFIQAMEEVIEQRQTSLPVRLMTNCTSTTILEKLSKELNLEPEDIYQANGLPDLTILTELASIDGYEELKYPIWKHFKTNPLKQELQWDVLKQKDVMLHVPYESYDTVLNFINQAADDEDVLAIKITLYRTSGNSPIVHALERAARNGKHVTAFVELKARFDEKRNISWANQLEHAGVIVVYGIANLKVHAKLLLIIRKEQDGIHRYVHLSTGNYNDKTARSYVDLSLFTSKNEIANDATLFFNMISGYSAIQTMQRLYMSPINMKAKLLSMIEREIQHSTTETPGLIMAKMNSLGHEDIIKALYRASCAGVRILLNVRGICMLVPGVKNMSENITVVSIIDRYLEHSRIFYFQNGGDEELYLSSADWMPRNLDRRVELMFPVIQNDLVKEIKNSLTIYFTDNSQSHILNSDGTWTLNKPEPDDIKIRAQEELYLKFKKQNNLQEIEQPKEFVVRRNG